MPNADALIFDFNGTLFWDTAFNTAAWDRISRIYRKQPYTEVEILRFNGRNSRETARFFLGPDVDEREILRVIDEKERFYRELCQKDGAPRLAPGAEELLEEAHRRGIRMAIATGAPKSNVESYLRWFPILSLFGSALLYDDGTRRGKPEPDIYRDAMRAIGATPQETVVFEDSPPGVESAGRAGIRRIYIVASPLAETAKAARMPGAQGTLTDFRQYLPLLPTFGGEAG
ncbi:MAG: HAD family hydrolase [Sphaerochaeta sp.]|nr:HAD family hydrolase [Sphaerochaeta sp.]MCH3920441.1 HAD family hydrolase [Sphaerochaeta sp.]MCI2045936.1 HAD family hydrolase [Sphaerochaeta sp.]MCI2076616.1 HAD family hydrolase [Sphaerochaeta sp.]MCI2097393.1 HAD family hydrolase [Sphaerochaeta sp.]